jgi:hypothetical protein
MQAMNMERPNFEEEINLPPTSKDRGLSRREIFPVLLGGFLAAKEMFAKPKTPETLSVDKFAEILKHREKVDLKNLWKPDMPVLIVGRRSANGTHDGETLAGMMEELMPEHIGIGTIGEELQPSIDKYVAGSMNKEQLIREFAFYGAKMAEFEDALPIINEAKRLNIPVSCWDKQRYPGGTNPDLMRSSLLASNINAAIKSGGTQRILVYCDNAELYPRADRPASLETNLNDKNLRVKHTAVELSGGSNKLPEPAVILADKVETAANKLGIQNDAFSIGIKMTDPSQEFLRTVIHQPETTNAAKAKEAAITASM